MNEIEALRRADFDWIYGLDDVWTEPEFDVPELHSAVRSEFARKLDEMERAKGAGSPLGWVVVGDGGTGKTHLLGAFRREAARRRHPFIMVDLTDARNFWANVLQGYVHSLQKEVEGGTPQYRWILGNIIDRLGPNKPVADILRMLAERKSTDLRSDIDKVLSAMSKAWREKTMRHQNVIRAIICMNSDDFSTSNQGQTWLQGQALEPEEKRAYGFTKESETPKSIVEALSWFLSLGGPAVLAFDQLDPIVAQLDFRRRADPPSEEAAAAMSIIAEIGGGLGTLRDATSTTLTIVSCIEKTWEALRNSFLKAALDRFEEPRRLSVLKTSQIAAAVAAGRLAPAFRSAGVPHPFPTYPFRPEAFEALEIDTPRELLGKCNKHVQKCVAAGAVEVLTAFGAVGELKVAPTVPTSDANRLDREFQKLRAAADPAWILEEKHDDERLAPLLRAGLACLAHETEDSDDVRATVEATFTGGAKTVPLHARLRRVFMKEEEREEHFCVRSIQHTNAKAYQNQLTAALTTSGIDRRLKFRRLAVVRSVPVPGGPKTNLLTEQFQTLGGVFVDPAADDLRSLHALNALRARNDPDFLAWLRARRPAFNLPLIRAVVGPAIDEFGKTTTIPDPPKETPPIGDGPPVDPPQSHDLLVPVGRKWFGGSAHETVSLSIQSLRSHTLVMAGSGSGKTMFLRRMVEEAALLGAPSIVVDVANDLAALGDRWDSPPAEWLDGDEEKAARYHVPGRVVVWTPNRAGGNPIWFDPLPDLSPLAGDREELDAAVAGACEALVPVVAKGKAQASSTKQGILARALRYMALRGAKGLDALIDVLSDLPPDAQLGVSKEAKHAAEMADALRVAREIDPLWKTGGAPFDPALLFGPADPGRPARVSVISLVGLPSLESQRWFLNQLAMTLFTWIKKNPAPLRGLLAIDEAKDFIPSVKASTCRESFLRLTSQARKYGLGLIFATQNPKDLDNKLASNCATHVYGRMNAPATIQAAAELMKQKGGSGDDLGKLPAGRFYFHASGMSAPVRIATAFSLSRHQGPLDEAAVIARAAASRPG